MKGNKICIALLALCFTVGSLPLSDYKEVSAGFQPIEMNSSILENGISANDWFITDDLKASSGAGKLVFDHNSNSSTRVTSQHKLSNMKIEGRTECLDAEMVFKISHIDNEKRFGIALGLPYSFEYVGASNSSFVYFEKTEGGLKIGVSKYDQAGTEQSVFQSTTAVAPLNTAFTLGISVTMNGGVALSVNGTTVMENAAATLNIAGYLGFGQTGNSVAEISGIEVYGYTNATPINANFCERFDRNEFNAIALYTRSDATKEENKGIYVENEKLAYKNVAGGHISTKKVYSNVDVSFDLQLARTAETDENGVLIRTVAAGFSLFFGAEEYTKASSNYEIRFDHTNSDFLHQNVKTIIKIFKDGECVTETTLEDKFNIFNEKLPKDTVVNVWASMSNGKLTVWLKFAGEVGFRKAFEYNFDETPLGYVQIASNGFESASPESTLCNMTIDNLSFTNFDMDGRTEELAFRTNIWNMDDFKYEDTWQDSDLIK